ncbi:GLD2 polymerase, partial [Emberiza fucata]|nr:GLD2 polymerase [Emberiza fucata]
MFPNSSNLGRPPFPPKCQQQSTFFTKLPLSMPPTLVSHQQIVVPPFHLRSAVGNAETTPAVTPAVTLQPVTYGSVSPVSTSDALTSFQGRKRQSQQSVPDDAKRQRIHSHDSDTAVVNQAVPLPKERRCSFPASVSVRSPVVRASGSPALIGCVPPLQDTLFPYPTEATLPVAKDEVMAFCASAFSVLCLCGCYVNRTNRQRLVKNVENQKALAHGSLRLDLANLQAIAESCQGLVLLKQEVSWFQILLQDLLLRSASCMKLNCIFSSLSASYIERPQLIRAKVPIVKFRDKVRQVFYVFILLAVENRVRPLVVVIKKWASFHEINDASRGTLNSYTTLTFFFIALPEPILPSLQKNYPECFDPTMQLHFVHQAPCTIPPYVSKNGSSLGDLLIGFFKYYATEFDWSHQMVSVREAKAIARPDGIEWRNKFICVE